MIASTRTDWQWSVYEYHRTWVGENSPEGFLVNQLAFNGSYALVAAARYFGRGVNQSLPSNPVTMNEIIARVLERPQPASIVERCTAICELGKEAAKILKRKSPKSVGPISAVSKFLMLRFPEDSFVYDKNARNTLSSPNCMEPDQLKDMKMFVDQWCERAYPKVQCIARAGIEGIDPAGAARIVDKFLWLKGSNEPNRPIPPEAPESHRQWVMDTGTAIWNRLREQGLTAPPEDAQH